VLVLGHQHSRSSSASASGRQCNCAQAVCSLAALLLQGLHMLRVRQQRSAALLLLLLLLRGAVDAWEGVRGMTAGQLLLWAAGIRGRRCGARLLAAGAGGAAAAQGLSFLQVTVDL
jgi:hypothetical protein